MIKIKCQRTNYVYKCESPDDVLDVLCAQLLDHAPRVRPCITLYRDYHDIMTGDFEVLEGDGDNEPRHYNPLLEVMEAFNAKLRRLGVAHLIDSVTIEDVVYFYHAPNLQGGVSLYRSPSAAYLAIVTST